MSDELIRNIGTVYGDGNMSIDDLAAVTGLSRLLIHWAIDEHGRRGRK